MGNNGERDEAGDETGNRNVGRTKRKTQEEEERGKSMTVMYRDYGAKEPGKSIRLYVDVIVDTPFQRDAVATGRT